MKGRKGIKGFLIRLSMQPLHAIMAGVALDAMLTPNWHARAAGLLAAILIVMREVKQFPSEATSTTPFWTKVGGWDTWLDAAGYLCGIVAVILIVVL